MSSSQAAALSSACSGAFGAVIALSITYPLAILKTRLQAQRNSSEKSTSVLRDINTPYSGSIDCLKRILVEEGAFKFYAGLRYALFKAFITNFIFYFFHGLFQKFIRNRSIHSGKTTKAFWSMIHGIIAGIGVQVCVLPVDMIVTRIQIDREKQSKGFSGIVYDIARGKGGVLNFWRGLMPGLWLTLNPGITTATRNIFQEYVDKSSYNASGNFGVGLISKATASVITYPYTVCKVRMQTRGISKNSNTKKKGLEQDEEEEALSFRETIKLVYDENGMIGFYNGLLPQLVNAILKEGILNMVRLEIRTIVESYIVQKT